MFNIYLLERTSGKPLIYLSAIKTSLKDKKIKVKPVLPIDLKLTTDNSGKTYIDSVLVLTTSIYKTNKIKVPGNLELITINVTSIISGIGFMVESSIGIVSNKSWKCTGETQTANWFNKNFKVDKWSNSVEYTVNSDGYMFRLCS